MNKRTYKSQNIVQRITEVTEAWSKHSPESKFAGMTLAEFQVAINPSLAVRQAMSQARLDLKGKVAEKTSADMASRELLRRVVGGVVADADHGANSALYRAMNYITLADRKSGLTRKSPTASDPGSAGATPDVPLAAHE